MSLFKEINESLDVADLFESVFEEFMLDIQALTELNVNTDGSVEWEQPTDAETSKFTKDKMVQQHGADAARERTSRDMIDNEPVPGDFVFFANNKTVGIIISVDRGHDTVEVINKDRKPLGKFDIRYLKLTGKSETSYKTVYASFKDKIAHRIAPDDAKVKRFLINNEVRGQG